MEDTRTLAEKKEANRKARERHYHRVCLIADLAYQYRALQTAKAFFTPTELEEIAATARRLDDALAKKVEF